MSEVLRRLPQVQSLLETEEGRGLVAVYGHEVAVSALRSGLQDVRAAVQDGRIDEVPQFGREFFDLIAANILSATAPNLRQVFNATGIVIHTNLGRSPLADEALQAINDVASGYSNLELDLEKGVRGSRYIHVEELICDLTGADGAIVVNNCAAAVVLCLSAFAAERDVIVSRGELIEIGGSFRLPDVIAQSGARLQEVGATNKTRISDYANAITEDTSVLLKSHTSNFRIVGFTDAPTRSELAELAEANDLVFMEDLGSGVLVNLASYGLLDEPVVADVLKQGSELVMFSGDKLLGGPQAGIIVGKEAHINRLKTHPLLRALRIDKLSLAALEATLRLYKSPHDPFARIPVLKTLAEPHELIETRAHHLAEVLTRLGVTVAEIRPTKAYAGGGSLPDQDLKSFAVALHEQAGEPHLVAKKLRAAEIPVLGRISDGGVLLDVIAVPEDDTLPLAKCVAGALA